MNTATPSIQNLARRLIALEAARDPSDGIGGAAVRACEKLRRPLAKLAGVAGYRALISWAMALATAEVPWLESVQVQADGSLLGFDASGRQCTGDQAGQGGAAVLVHLLGLLVTFIGESLTWRLVRDAWPDAATDETAGQAGGQT